MDAYINAREIIELAADNLLYIGPALLVLSALSVADQLTDFAIRIMRRTSKDYRL